MRCRNLSTLSTKPTNIPVASSVTNPTFTRAAAHSLATANNGRTTRKQLIIHTAWPSETSANIANILASDATIQILSKEIKTSQISKI